MSMKKIFAEGSLETIKTILGWTLNFENLTAPLKEEKFEEQTSDIGKILKDGEKTIKQLDATVGSNGHTFHMFQLGLHFQNRLRRMIDRRFKLNRCMKLRKIDWTI